MQVRVRACVCGCVDVFVCIYVGMHERMYDHRLLFLRWRTALERQLLVIIIILQLLQCRGIS
jgi:hypothetical protein